MIKKADTVLNRYVWITASVFGAVFAIAGIHHGYFEILQGNKITGSFIIQSIAMEHQRWLNGEEAFTLLHNFLLTGIASVIVSLTIIIWSLWYLHKPYGSAIFLMLFMLLTLVGGGIVHILFFLPVWFFSGKTGRKLSWRKGESTGRKTGLSAIWPFLLIITCLLYISALEISIFGISGFSDETIEMVIYIQLLTALITLLLTFYAAIARDILSYQLSVSEKPVP